MKRKGTAVPPSDTPGDARTFEAMMERLQELVARLETGNLTLEESIQSFEEGMALVRKCTAVLSQSGNGRLRPPGPQTRRTNSLKNRIRPKVPST